MLRCRLSFFATDILLCGSCEREREDATSYYQKHDAPPRLKRQESNIPERLENRRFSQPQGRKSLTTLKNQQILDEPGFAEALVPSETYCL